MAQVLAFIQGKRTYIMAAVYGIDSAGAELGWWQADSVRAIVEQVFTVVFLRAGVQASGPAVAPAPAK